MHRCSYQQVMQRTIGLVNNILWAYNMYYRKNAAVMCIYLNISYLINHIAESDTREKASWWRLVLQRNCLSLFTVFHEWSSSSTISPPPIYLQVDGGAGPWGLREQGHGWQSQPTGGHAHREQLTRHVLSSTERRRRRRRRIDRALIICWQWGSYNDY